MEKFLLQVLESDYTSNSETSTYCKLMTAAEIIKYVNFSDFYPDLIYFKVYRLNDADRGPELLHYCGWQPNCLIQFTSSLTDEVVISGYGEDH